jgi:membrane-associated phospholipid phosphatase
MNQQYCVKKQVRLNVVVFFRMTSTNSHMNGMNDTFRDRPWPLTLALGLVIIVLAAVIFGALAEQVTTNTRITILDVRLAHWFHAHATPGFTRAMLLITHVNGLAGTSVMAALLALWFWRRAYRSWLFLTLAAVPGGLVLNIVLKHVFQRARPSFADPLVTLESYSFPSGHTAASTVFYGLLACWLVHRLDAGPVRTLAVAACCAMVLLVALSRMYLGAHYLSDVLAAAAEGCAWLAVCLMATGAWRRRHGQVREGA